jgi:ecotin
MDKSPWAATLTCMRPSLLCLALACSLATVSADEKPRRASDGSSWEKAYPAPKAGYRRVVIHLEAKPDEDDWRVEVVVGQVRETDGVNRVGLVGRIEERTVEGWGYTYLEAPVSKGAFSTKIGVPSDQPPVQAFVTFPAHGPFRHNSRLPIVIYLPEGYEARHRLWKAVTPFEKGSEG